MKVVVGIGNIGKRYEGTRHNVGFDVVDMLAAADGIDIRKKKFDALLGEGTIAGERVVLVKPQTYVNNSGICARGVLDFWSVPAHDMMVVCDDANLDLGKLRVRRDGSSGGHNGLASIATHLGSEEFPRLRVGIGRRGEGLVNHVLGRFSAAEKKLMDESYIDAMRALTLWISSGVDRCMNEFNG